MAIIIPRIVTLVQYMQEIKENSTRLIPKYCPTCKKYDFTYHGCYYRNVNYDKKPNDERISNIPIFRYYCRTCCATFSALPECIPPRRHYLWSVQQRSLEPVLQGKSYNETSQSVKPSRWTIRRWFNRLHERASIHFDHLRSLLPDLGRINEFAKGWLTISEKYGLAHIMCSLHHADIAIP